METRTVNNNYCIIMCGDIGSHFWPYSRKKKPKQFLDLMNTGESLLQYTFERFQLFIPEKNIYIITNREYAHWVYEQLPQLAHNQVLLEPTRRGTAACIAWATYHIYALNSKASIVVTPSDHLIFNENRFQSIVIKGLDFAAQTDALLTIGIKPTRPEVSYGYIQVSEEPQGDFCKVKTFTEKPQIDIAQAFIESGEFYWNSGLFIWSAESILQSIETYLPEVATELQPGLTQQVFGSEKEEAFINEHFPICPHISIDFGILEKAENSYMLLADFGWVDLCSWNSLYEVSQKDENQNVAIPPNAMMFNSKNNLVLLPQGKYAILDDLEGYLVVESDNALLICKRDNEDALRHITNEVLLKYGEKLL